MPLRMQSAAKYASSPRRSASFNPPTMSALGSRSTIVLVLRLQTRYGMRREPSCPMDACLNSYRLGSNDRMVGELFTLPLRVGVRATQLWLRATGEAVGMTVQLAVRVLDRGRDEAVGGPPPPSAPGQGVVRASDPAVPARRPALVLGEGAPSAPAATGVADAEHEPGHVSEEPELVEESSEPGAEDGAGAQVRVQQPWDGYERATAKEVIARLQTASPAELATVQLYERGHRGRQTVLAAVERQLRTANGSGSPTSERNR